MNSHIWRNIIIHRYYPPPNPFNVNIIKLINFLKEHHSTKIVILDFSHTHIANEQNINNALLKTILDSFPNLEYLSLMNSKILGNLNTNSFWGMRTRVDENLKVVNDYPNLKVLNISHTNLSREFFDYGLKDHLPNLEALYMAG